MLTYNSTTIWGIVEDGVDLITHHTATQKFGSKCQQSSIWTMKQWVKNGWIYINKTTFNYEQFNGFT